MYRVYDYDRIEKMKKQNYIKRLRLLFVPAGRFGLLLYFWKFRVIQNSVLGTSWFYDRYK
jgi:hypothetical protein